MGALQRFEQKLESLVNGAFARAFRAAVEPVEISAALQREVDNNSQILSRDRRIVPNDFRVELSDADFERLTQGGDALVHDLAAQLEEHAVAQGYVFPGDVEIEFDRAGDLSTGRFRIASASKAGVTGHTPARPAATPAVQPAQAQAPAHAAPVPAPTPAAYAPPAQPARPAGPQVVLEINGTRHVLNPSLVVGRGSEADIRISDPGVSRKHAEFALLTTAEGTLVTVTDLGSTNGMTVNGHPMDRAALRNGTVVRIGSTDVVVHVDSPERG